MFDSLKRFLNGVPCLMCDSKFLAEDIGSYGYCKSCLRTYMHIKDDESCRRFLLNALEVENGQREQIARIRDLSDKSLGNLFNFLMCNDDGVFELASHYCRSELNERGVSRPRTLNEEINIELLRSLPIVDAETRDAFLNERGSSNSKWEGRTQFQRQRGGRYSEVASAWYLAMHKATDSPFVLHESGMCVDEFEFLFRIADDDFVQYYQVHVYDPRGVGSGP